MVQWGGPKDLLTAGFECQRWEDMPIDNCKLSFEELANNRFPVYMQKLLAVEKYKVTMFAESGKGPSSLLKKVGMSSDFMGLYVFWEEDRPIYVGISRKVIGRIRQHVLGRNHFDASLAFKMAASVHPIKGQRKELMSNEDFNAVFIEMKRKISRMQVGFIPIDNDLELYLFEVYSAMYLDTSKWNTFRTH